MSDTGLLQAADWGTSTTITASIGKVTGGDMLPFDSALAHREGIGAQDSIVGGPVPIGGNVEFTVQNDDILAYALRSAYTSPALTDLCFAGGKAAAGVKHTGCKINTLNLKCSVGEALTANAEWLATSAEAYSTAAQAYLTGSTFEWHTGTATIDSSAALGCQSFDITVNNNCEHVWTLDAATAASQRFPNEVKIGSQEVTLKCDVLVHNTSTVLGLITADTLASDKTAVFVLKGGTSGTQTLTISLSNLAYKSAPIPFEVGGGLIVYSLEFEAVKDKAVITIATT